MTGPNNDFRERAVLERMAIVAVVLSALAGVGLISQGLFLQAGATLGDMLGAAAPAPVEQIIEPVSGDARISVPPSLDRPS
ncbi:hypothetical protein [Rhodobium gokarnense]|uniref:Uncharacterized protein n=1 Tax=Rhodobium gokarnense TaxID=364296 RepID=A0ABT3H5Y8_9HYPH|nr:hypothetical protein [Rhodobium gokarnense]MCW2305800.1 hypothetical protein [Rhodobium gokarnense]